VGVTWGSAGRTRSRHLSSQDSDTTKFKDVKGFDETGCFIAFWRETYKHPMIIVDYEDLNSSIVLEIGRLGTIVSLFNAVRDYLHP
jgi:hypothetical protein